MPMPRTVPGRPRPLRRGAACTASRWASLAMPMKSTTTMPPMLRRRNWRGIAGRCFEVRLERGVGAGRRVQTTAAVDVDRGHRLGLFDDEPAAARQRHAGVEQIVDGRFQTMRVEERARIAVANDPVGVGRHVRGGVPANGVVGLVVVDDDRPQAGPGEVAHRAQHRREFLEEQRRRVAGLVPALPDLPPEPAQVAEVRFDLGAGRHRWRRCGRCSPSAGPGAQAHRRAERRGASARRRRRCVGTG